jgi:hypothetical protein
MGWLESDLGYMLFTARGYVVGAFKTNVMDGEVWATCARTGTNGNFGGPGQLAVPPEMDDLMSNLHAPGMVWTCAVTVVNDNQVQVTFSNDNPLYAGVTWVSPATGAKTGIVASPLKAGHGEVSREWRAVMKANGWANTQYGADEIVTPSGPTILTFAL